MKTFGTLVLAFFASAFVAGIVQNQLAVAFGAREEFIAVMMLFVLTAITVTVVFGVALAVAKTVSGIDWTALGLLVVTVLLLIVLSVLGAGSIQNLRVTAQDLPIIAEILVPTALLIAIQWWFVRRRWRRANAASV
jgi:hypothetical protein